MSLVVQADLSTRAGVDRVVREIMARFGGVDILVNNVGGSSAPSGGVLALNDADWQDTIDANLLLNRKDRHETARRERHIAFSARFGMHHREQGKSGLRPGHFLGGLESRSPRNHDRA